MNGITTVSHSEFVLDLNAVPDFTTSLRSFSVNPGNVNLFPWLSAQANSYEFYRLKKAHVRFVTESSTRFSGRMILGADYDVTDPQPSSASELMNMSGSTYGPLWQNLTFPLSPPKVHAENKWMYTRTSAIEPQRNTDGARIYVSATSDNENSIGMLFIDYTFEFKAPQVPRPYNPNPDDAFFARFTAPAPPLDPGVPTIIDFSFPEYNTINAKQIGPSWLFPLGTYLWNFLVCTEVDTKSGSEPYNFRVSSVNPQWGLPAIVASQTRGSDGIARDDLNSGGYFVSDGVTPFDIEAQCDIANPTALLTLIAGTLLMTKVKTV